MALWHKNTRSLILEKLDTIISLIKNWHARTNLEIYALQATQKTGLEGLTEVVRAQSEMIARLTDMIERQNETISVQDAETEYYVMDPDEDLENKDYIDGFIG